MGRQMSHREIREGMFGLSRIGFARVVMLGDSLTEGAPWAEITGCPYVANRGIGADTSTGVLKRIDEVLVLRPAAVFLMIGVNDVASAVPPERVVGNVSRAIAKIAKSGARVYLALVLPVADSYKQRINPRIEELNVAYGKLAKMAGVSLVDFTAGVQTSGYLREELSTDGIHLRPEGYRVWRDAIAPFVDLHCKAGSAADIQPSAAGRRR